MSFRFTAKQIAEEALKKIGAFSLHDSGADPVELDRALTWLDLIVAEQAGKRTCHWLIPDTVSLSLTGGTADYDMNAVLGVGLPDNGIQFPVSATISDDNGNETPLTLVHRDQYEEIPDKTSTGTPEWIYIDRLYEPTLKTYPVLGSGVTGYTINLVVQRFSETFHNTKGNQATELRPAWQLWAIYKLAATIGDGTVRRVPDREIKMFHDVAKTSEVDLLAFEETEHASGPSRTAFRDF